MKFQSCATVLYALGKHKDKLYEKDLEVNSPYNTYLVKGLPVGPISSP
ncbi:MAG TPA: cell division protein YceG, partial [Clostridium sp.]|nr:cell division protein YceG [Clostridium sp.]